MSNALMSDTATTRPPRATDVLSVLIIAPAVASAWIWFVGPVRVSRLLLVGLSVVGSATFGIMAWFWAADHAWTRLSGRLVLGCAAGLGPPVTVLVAAALGLLCRHGAADSLQLLGQGAPIPGYGLLPWPAFVTFSAECSSVGGISGVIQWVIVRSRGLRR